MSFLNYYIRFKNWIGEGEDVEIQIQDLDTLDDPPGPTVEIELEGKDVAVLMDSVTNEDNKTEAIKGRRLTFGFNSGEYDVDGVDTVVDVGTFSDGDDGRFRVRLGTGTGPLAVPFLGNLVLDDNSEAFQPRPNPVQLRAGEGFGNLKEIELKDAGEIAIGHYSIMDYFVMILDELVIGQDIHVLFNLYETDTDPDTSHAFKDTFVNALTFETDVDKRDDRFTVLTKILEAFGCFLTHDNDGWWIIRWDEYDRIGTSLLTHRIANFSNDGTFQNYTLENLTKRIASDQDVLYEGYYMSFDSAQRRFQSRAKAVTHTYRFEIPKDVPCNKNFSRGDFVSGTSTYRLYQLDDWVRGIDFPTGGTPTADVFIKREVDTLGYETVRYILLEPEASTSEMYVESCAIPVGRRDKFTVSWDWAFSADAAGSGGYTRRLAIIRLEGFDSTYWTLDEDGKWYQSNVTWTVNLKILQQTIELGDDQTQFINFSLDAEEIPREGNLYIMFLSESQSRYVVDVYINSFSFDYKPFVGSGYDFLGSQRPNRPFATTLIGEAKGQQHRVFDDTVNDREIKHEMFITDSPRPLFKGALKKFDGTNYVLTETWSDYAAGLTMADQRLAKHILFQWWNQFRKTRTVIETDVQGLNSGEATGIPGMIHRWAIQHEGQETKWFMLTGFRGMDFYKCGWQGVFVETSDLDGDRNYDDEYEFSYIE